MLKHWAIVVHPFGMAEEALPQREAFLSRATAFLFRQKLADEGAFFFEFVDGGVDFGAAEVVDGEALDDFEFFAVAADGEGTDEAFFDVVAAVRTNGDAVPIAGRAGFDDRANGVDDGVSSASRAGKTAGFEDRCAALLDGGNEFALEPCFVGDDLSGGAAIDFGVVEVGILGRGMVAPDGDVGDGGDVDAGFFRELRFGAVFVEASHGVETVARNLGRVVHRNEAVGVAGIADDKDADVRRGIFLDGLALAGEDFAVDAEQVLTLHALLARNAADEQSPVHAAKAFIEIGSWDDAFEQREGAIIEFHHNAAESGEGGLDFDEVENYRLIRAEHGTGGDAKEQRIADLASGAGDGDTDGGGRHGYVQLNELKRLNGLNKHDPVGERSSLV
jgi:hypothetical protein